MKHFISILGLALLAQSSYADIFQCIDSAGNAVFKDHACGTGETFHKKINIEGSVNESVGDSPEDSPQVIAPDQGDAGELGKNLLKNPSFENRLVDWRVPVGAAWSVNQGFKGSGALIIHAEKPPNDRFIHETVVEQCVLLVPGEKYGLSARFKLEKIPSSKSANRANVIWFEDTNCKTGGQYGWFIEPQNTMGWQELSVKNLTPALGAKAAKITIVQAGRHSNDGKGAWDDIDFAVTEVFERSGEWIDTPADKKYTLSQGVNYLSNGNFDSGVTAWRPGLKLVWSDTQGDKSPGSARVVAPSKFSSIGRGAFSQCINFGENTDFEMGASYKRDETSTQTGGGRLRVSWREELGCHGRGKTDTKSVNPEDKDGWQRLLVTDLRPPPGATSALIEIIQVVDGAGEFAAYWDDIYFTAVETKYKESRED